MRALAKAWDLPTWDKPAAACLSSRIAYGVPVTPAALRRIETSEAALKEKGLFRLEGRDYLVKDGDVMLFRFNV